MTDLDELITALEKGPPPQSISDPALLLVALKELRDMVGNSSIKNTIAQQVSYLINRGKGNGKQPVMLNTLLYGSPGVGKTKIGLKLAKIWYALGYLRKREAQRSVTTRLSSVSTETVYLYVMVAFILYSILGSFLVWCCKKIGWVYVLLIITVLVALLLLLWMAQKPPPPEPQELQDRDLITVTSREDFVDKYVGWSDKKTRALLEANLGKVLFIDEAYSLVRHKGDTYGKEAVDTINRFLSEHPEEIVVIMAGYKDLLQGGVFSVQPGLPRRFMWHLECSSYSPEELFLIFQQQLEARGYRLQEPEACLVLFQQNPTFFPSQAGDTERLTFYVELEYAKDQLKKPNQEGVTAAQLERGLATLQSNNINQANAGSNKSHSIQDVLRLISDGGYTEA